MVGILRPGTADVKRTGIKRKTPLKPSNKRLGPGKKTKKWATTRSGLKPRFEAAGITTCELRYPGCWFNNGLGFAHAKKRRKLSEEDLEVVILACNPCHDKIEYSPNMEETVMKVIENRGVTL